MVNSSVHDLLRKANDPETDLDQLNGLVDLGEEVLSAAVALHPECDKRLLDRLATLNFGDVQKNLCQRFQNYPDLYSLNVREIKVSDAEYIFQLRSDVTYNKYISKIDDNIETQRRFIEGYLEKNRTQRESFYFILENKTTGARCGTVRIYNFNGDVFEWGSWILDEKKSRYSALETAILIYEYAFNILGFDRSEFEVNKDNVRVIDYHKKSGAEVIGEDDVNLYFRVRKNVGLAFAKSLRERLETSLR
ncbi:GNAT family N-acetyltransferase [Thalassobius sp. I31.1]|uniref:GNAT family N-acetyltransferase n=1 Tax=Thalassobius sp. I31.1 TaxID=2109912 RepID=UPI000D19BE65|nr:GNAT family N-acetyltransferase [Thalassobius sp. I31.1]